MKKRRRRRTIIVPVVSMGDIAFLLIIFFILCSNIAREAGIAVAPPVSADLDQVDESTQLFGSIAYEDFRPKFAGQNAQITGIGGFFGILYRW